VNGLRKNKTFALLSVICAATVLGILVFSASATEATTNEEESASIFRGIRNRWLDTLTDDQLTTIKEMLEENRAEVKDQLEAWDAEISELDDEQRELIKTMMKENHAEVQAQLEEWGIEIPLLQDQMGWQCNLTDEQKEELQTMKQNYLDSVKAKLEEWGIEVPETDGPRGFGTEVLGKEDRGFGLFKP
jgi:uncharacterized protein YnzC (UPF0291/DUF896 family)